MNQTRAGEATQGQVLAVATNSRYSDCRQSSSNNSITRHANLPSRRNPRVGVVAPDNRLRPRTDGHPCRHQGVLPAKLLPFPAGTEECQSRIPARKPVPIRATLRPGLQRERQVLMRVSREWTQYSSPKCRTSGPTPPHYPTLTTSRGRPSSRLDMSRGSGTMSGLEQPRGVSQALGDCPISMRG